MVSFEWYEITLFVFLVLYLAVTLILAILFFQKYHLVKQNEFLYMGLLVFIFSLSNTLQWIISFIVLATTGITLHPTFLYAIQGISSLSVIFWFLGFHKLVLSNNPMRYLITGILISSLIIIGFIYYTALFIDYSLIGTLDPKGWTPLTWTFLTSTLLALAYLVFFSTFLTFVIKALNTPDTKIQLKGKILLIASILLAVSILATFILAFFQGILYWIVTFSIVHVARIVAFILFYIGFTLPKFIEKRFLKEL
ncbi:MAG: membrane protein of unknown function [Promethearchaeota archaeon]|nr:MAG: membrane protein of unknown function [Candidatus Lokiarchaeota archaeon]